MNKFDHLKELDVAGTTSWMDIPEISPKARLCLKLAGESNKPYYNAMLKLAGRRTRQMIRMDTIEAESLAQNRIDDRELFPLYVITGWEGIEDEGGKPVPFNRKNCQEFCEILPAWIFDKIRNHASIPERFLLERAPEPAELAGNSQSASDSS